MRPYTILFLLIFFNSFGRALALDMGSYYDQDTNRTFFRVYATNATRVEVQIFTSEMGVVKFSKSMNKVSVENLDSQNRVIGENTFETSLDGDYRNQFYNFKVFGNSSIAKQIVSNAVIKAHSKRPADIFLFNQERGNLVATTASGYMNPSTSIPITKTFIDGYSCFNLNSADDSFENYYVEVMPEGIFPERINGFPVLDPYCRRVSNYNQRCEVLAINDDLGSANRGYQPSFRVGHTIHEVHLKDLTMLLDTVPEEIRGTFRGAAHPSTIRMLKEMQVSTIEFLPLHSFDVKAAPPGHINYWGYMTQGFFALHNAYASTDGSANEEFKQLVEALHEAEIAVVLDVVYNHTSEGDHRGPTVSFKNLARDEYFRMYDSKKGYYLNSTGVGNTCKSESPVMRKLILDSLKYFVREFHVDGFRFDLGAAIDKTTFEKIREALPENTLLTAEPWVADGQPQWERSDLNGIRLGKWNDQFRKAIKGDYSKPGFINGEANEKYVRVLVRGESLDFGGSGSFVFHQPGDTNPASLVNEIEVHDGFTIFDWLHHLKVSPKDIEARIRLSSTLLLTSINTPIVQLGQEFGRSKQGDHNSYDKDSPINYIDWSLKNKNRNLSDFVNGLKRIRLHFDAFHFNNRINDDRLIFLDDLRNSPNAFGYQLKGSNEVFIVLLNGSTSSGTDFKLPQGIWNIISDGERVSPRGLGKVTNQHFYLHPSSSAILFQKKL